LFSASFLPAVPSPTASVSGRSMLRRRRQTRVSLRRSTTTNKRTFWPTGPRPHLVTGPSLNSPMNLVTSLATYAAMSRELGLPLRFPGTKDGWNTLQETTDAELFGRATLWALGEDKARNEIFNVSNGDVYRWRQLWNELAAFYDLPIAEPLAMSTVTASTR